MVSAVGVLTNAIAAAPDVAQLWSVRGSVRASAANSEAELEVRRLAFARLSTYMLCRAVRVVGIKCIYCWATHRCRIRHLLLQRRA